MESEETMELRDLPVDTRNYTIIDNITGKPIEQSNYSLTIDPLVIGKLNELKRVNEEKIRQASLKSQYGDEISISNFVFSSWFNFCRLSFNWFSFGFNANAFVICPTSTII